ncbi:MAG: type I polyketide synthase, partial [Elusimicrobiota bacterium]
PAPSPGGRPRPAERSPRPAVSIERRPAPARVSAGAPEPVSAAPVAVAADPVMDGMRAAEAAKTRAHETFLRFSRGLAETFSMTLEHQMKLMRSGASPAAGAVAEREPGGVPREPGSLRPAFDRGKCLEFARGRIADVLGPEFAEADSHPTRVRLPDEPLMLVDRIMKVDGRPRSMSSGRVVTEHDVLGGAWYLDGGRIPTCVAVEAGQADLFLSGYLGIDLQTKGEAMYRLLDASVCFHRALPRPGDTIRYDIRIERFFRQGSTYLFRFSFDGTVNGEPLLTMREGCAGFFTRAELDGGRGIVHTELDKRPMPGKKSGFEELVPVGQESYDEGRLEALRAGDLAGCFGPAFAGLGLRDPLSIPGGRMKLVDRVARLDPRGGRFGLGQIRAEADIHPDDWFLTCHFVDDKVMPGTLMYECCLHTLRIFLTRLGWVGEREEVVCEPVPGISSRLKCRGQVIETTKKAAYEVSVKELGYRPDGTPYAIADALMYSDGRPIVEMTDMSIQLTGLTHDKVRRTWRAKAPRRTGPLKRPAIFDTGRILAFAVGKPSEAFGEPYKVFDRDRVIARLPGPPYQFLDRITGIRAEPWKLEAGGEVEAQYDVPPDAWYFGSNRQTAMPFAVLLEVALQPCGWLAAYLGSALTSDTDLSFRNLGGTAAQYLPVGPDAGTLSTTVKITDVSTSGGMIIQHFDFEMAGRAGLVYKGNTYFGFFSKRSLADQVGIRDAKLYEPDAGEKARGRGFAYPRRAPFPDDKLRMIDRIDLFVPDGGPKGLGFVQGSVQVDPGAWFFKAHFHQDPVWPGSLGLESFLQLLKAVAAERWNAGAEAAFENAVINEEHRWIYRGQIIPGDRRVTVAASVTEIDDERRLMRADGYLSVDGRVIYEMRDFTLRLGGGGR